MRMSKAAQYHLTSALVFQGQYRLLIEQGDVARAEVYADWRDEHLAKAGLPSFGDLVQVKDPYRRKPRSAYRAGAHAAAAQS